MSDVEKAEAFVDAALKTAKPNRPAGPARHAERHGVFVRGRGNTTIVVNGVPSAAVAHSPTRATAYAPTQPRWNRGFGFWKRCVGLGVVIIAVMLLWLIDGHTWNPAIGIEQVQYWRLTNSWEWVFAYFGATVLLGAALGSLLYRVFSAR